MTDHDYIYVIRGALLHDIGKLIQRAQNNPTSKKHTQWGYEWLKENLCDDVAANAADTHHFTDDTVFKTNRSIIWSSRPCRRWGVLIS